MEHLRGHEHHAKPRTPINPLTYQPVAPYAFTTNNYHDCGLTLDEAIKAFVRYGHPITLILDHGAWIQDYDGVVVLGWSVFVNDNPDIVKWFGIPQAAEMFADHPLVDPLEAEVVMMKVRVPS